jgi:hypothetical protein
VGDKIDRLGLAARAAAEASAALEQAVRRSQL